MKKSLSILALTLCYYAATLACLFIGALHPFLWVYGALTCAVLAAWPYCRLVNQHPYPGMALLVTTVSVIINMALGEGDMLYVSLALAIGLVAEGVRVIGGYKSLTSQILGYCVIALLPFANTLRMWILPEESMQITLEEMGADYADKMKDVLPVWLLVCMVLVTILLAAIMAMVCNRKRCQTELLDICSHPKNNWLSSMMLKYGMNYGHRMLSRFALEHLVLSGQEKDVLDIGCGGGYNLSLFLKQLPQATIQGLDYSEKSVEMSRQYNRKAVNQGRCIVHQGNVVDLPYQAEEFDVVSAFETIYFWPNIEDCFKGICRILRDNGRFMVVGDMPQVANQWAKGSDVMHIYSPEEVTAMMKNAGFSHVDVYTTNVIMCIIGTK